MTRPIEHTLSANELKDLDELVHHPGWKLIELMVDREWGAQGFAEKIARSVGDPNMPPALAVSQIQQATVSREAVTYIMKWPRRALSEAKARATDHVASLASMNRGGL